MNIISLDKNGKLVFVPQNLEDLWIIKSITDVKDKISGQSYRRTRGNENDDESARKPVFVSIEIEKFDFSKDMTSLRFTGKIIESKPTELAPIGEHHTLEIQFNKSYTLIKEHFFEHQLELLNSNSSLEQSVILITLDDEKASIFQLTNTGTTDITKINSGKHGKRYSSDFDYSDYFKEILDVVSRYDTQIIIAGPGNTKSKFSAFLKSKLNNLKILEINISNTEKSSIRELFKKQEVSRFFTNSIIYKEQKIFDDFLENLGKDNKKAIYGLKEIENAVDFGAIETILVSEELWKKDLDKISELIKKAEKQKMKVHIVDNSHETHKALKSFGGIIANLRFAYN
jgi:protein pelota